MMKLNIVFISVQALERTVNMFGEKLVSSVQVLKETQLFFLEEKRAHIRIFSMVASAKAS